MNPLGQIRSALNLSQKDFAAAIGVSQQAYSQAETGKRIPPHYKKELLKAFPSRKRFILEFFDEDNTDQSVSDVDIGNIDAFDEPPQPKKLEEEALPWAVNFRAPCLLRELVVGADASQLSAVSIKGVPYGILLQKRESVKRQHSSHAGSLLYPGSGEIQLKPDTAIFVGSPYRHSFASELMEALTNDLSVEIIFSVSKSNRYFYFGYSTTLVNLSVKEQPSGKWKFFRSERWEDDSGSLFYKDFGLILFSTINADHCVATDQSKGLFNQLNGKRTVLIAGNHRLATGIGTRLFAYPDMVDEYNLDAFSDKESGGCLFEVVVKASERMSTIDNIEILHRWPKNKRAKAHQ